jgi:hypothetical protein
MQLLHIGRSPECEIVVNHDSISRQHAQLFIEDSEKIFIIDLNSTNGTFVNGVKIQGKHPLRSGDSVKLGEHPWAWEPYIKAILPQPRPELGTIQNPETGAPPTSKTRNITLWVGIGIGICLVFASVFWLWPNKTGKLNGEWKQSEDPKAWIRFEDNGTYSEGYGGKAILDGAKWETRGENGLLITREGITVTRKFTLNGDELSITQDSATVDYERSAR